jgi:hypothetical protein
MASESSGLYFSVKGFLWCVEAFPTNKTTSCLKMLVAPSLGVGQVAETATAQAPFKGSWVNGQNILMRDMEDEAPSLPP